MVNQGAVIYRSDWITFDTGGIFRIIDENGGAAKLGISRYEAVDLADALLKYALSRDVIKKC